MPYKDPEKRKSFARDYNRSYMKRWRRDNPDKATQIEQRRYAKRGPQTDYANQWRKDNPDMVKAARLKRYGISKADFDRLYADQNSVCAICRQSSNQLQVDHDHVTEVVRGLLCPRCNVLVSCNDVQSAEDVLSYLQSPPFLSSQEDRDRKLLDLAKHVAKQSPDPSTKVGAVIAVGPTVISTGYNHFPNGVEATTERLNNRADKLKFMVHAEQNALIQAGHAAIGCTLYVYPSFGSPNICHDCAKLAIQAGIDAVVGYRADESNPRWANWQESLELSGQMFKEAGVHWDVVEP